jgi:hypothetical protein
VQVKDRKFDLTLLETLDFVKAPYETNADMVASIICTLIFSAPEETR